MEDVIVVVIMAETEGQVEVDKTPLSVRDRDTVLLTDTLTLVDGVLEGEWEREGEVDPERVALPERERVGAEEEERVPVGLTDTLGDEEEDREEDKHPEEVLDTAAVRVTLTEVVKVAMREEAMGDLEGVEEPEAHIEKVVVGVRVEEMEGLGEAVNKPLSV